MRLNITLIACLVASPYLSIAQLPAGSVALFSLDNTAADNSGNGNNGTLTSTTGATNRFGSANAATSFTAGSSSGSFPLQLVTTTANDFSVGFWFKTSMTAPSSPSWYGGTALVDAEVCGGTSDWGTALIDGGKVALGIGNPDITIKSTAATYNDGNWHFVTATRNAAAGVITLYVDGAQVATTNGTATTARTAPTFIGLGNNPCVTTGVYTGSLDDAIAYSRELSPTEATSLYNYYNITPLPLQWISFAGQIDGTRIHLEWQTANSVNNDRFEVQRSTDGKTFAVIGTLPDKGGVQNTIGEAAYDYTDNDPVKGNNFYRIRQVDKDGRSSFSSVVTIVLQTFSTAFHLQQNPVVDQLSLVNAGQRFIQRIQIIDVAGRAVIDRAVNSTSQLVQVGAHSLVKGYYVVKIRAKGGDTAIGFVKQ